MKLYETVQVKWVTTDKENATEKAIRLTEMAIAKASALQPLVPMKSPVEKRALVIGGGISPPTGRRTMSPGESDQGLRGEE